MKCPSCGHPESKVLDSRPANEGVSIRRRRECLACQKRFTTFETIEIMSFMVVKKDKTILHCTFSSLTETDNSKLNFFHFLLPHNENLQVDYITLVSFRQLTI